MNKASVMLFGALAAVSEMTVAHPGHGVEGHANDVLHPLFGSEHGLLLSALVIGAVLLHRRLRGGSDRHDGE